MRHRKKTVKLGRSSAHREALFASLVCSLIRERRIRTTLPKARVARSLAEKMVTLGKRGTLAARRQAVARLRRKDLVGTLFDTIAPAFGDRNGGYCRIVKLGRRGGDNAEMAVLEWVNYSPEPAAKKKVKTAKTEEAEPKGKKGAAQAAKAKKAESRKSKKKPEAPRGKEPDTVKGKVPGQSRGRASSKKGE